MHPKLALAALLLSSLAACGGGSTTSTQSSSSGGETNSTGLPASFEPAQGEHAFGVYLVVVPSTDTAAAETQLAELRARGVTGGGSGQLSCDQGASAVLGASDDDLAVSVDFRTREDAQRFVDAWGSPVRGIAEFVAFCRD